MIPAEKPKMILFNSKNKSSIELELLEVETDRAAGIEVKVHIKRKYFNAKFFSLWIEKTDLSKFISDIRRLYNGKAAKASLNSPDEDDLHLILIRKDQIFFIGIRVKSYNFTPINIQDSVTLSLEIDKESIMPFINGLVYIRDQYF
jgi:hypothetical protein